MRAFKAGLLYFALVFGMGFVLGIVRVTMVVPALGARLAELIELPVMVIASYFAARFVLGRFGPFGANDRVRIGVLALIWLLAAELAVMFASGQLIGDYIAARDPVSGTAYLVSLLLFALMPALAGIRGGRSR